MTDQLMKHELLPCPSFAELQNWFFQTLTPQQRDGFLLLFGLDFGSTASFEIRHKSLREIHRQTLTRPTPTELEMVDDLRKLEDRLTSGAFYEDHDEDLRLLGVFRAAIASLTPDNGVVEALLDIADANYNDLAGNPLEWACMKARKALGLPLQSAEYKEARAALKEVKR